MTCSRFLARCSCSADLKSTLVSTAKSIREANASLTALATRSKPKAMKQAPIRASVTSGSGREPPSRTSAGIASSRLGLGPLEHLRDAELAADLGAGDAADGLVVDLRQAAGIDLSEALVEVGGDGERENAVAEVGEPLVGVDALLGPGGVGQGQIS